MLKGKLECLTILISFLVVFFEEVHGHGMMLDPVSRSSRWRYDKTAPINYDDNGLFCGGFGVQWYQNKGKCGMCGDNFKTAKPRPNELGGKYGQGVITKNYVQDQIAKLGIKITTNHLGFFYFHLCNLDKFGKESEECFLANRINFNDGSDKMYIGKKGGWVNATIVLPKGLSCKHCVLRWNYQGGNNWGPCGNGTSAIGCGPQENFKGCADIRIAAKPHQYNPQNLNFKAPDDLSYVVFEPLDKIQNENNLSYEPLEPETREKPDFDLHEAVVEEKPKTKTGIFDFFKNLNYDNNLDYGSYEALEDIMPDFGANDILFDEDEESSEEEDVDARVKPLEDRKTFFDMINSLFEFDKEEKDHNALDEGLFDIEDF